jgi:hypothetical protein
MSKAKRARVVQRPDVMRRVCIFMSSAFKENFKFCPQGFDNGYALSAGTVRMATSLSDRKHDHTHCTMSKLMHSQFAQSLAEDVNSSHPISNMVVPLTFHIACCSWRNIALSLTFLIKKSMLSCDFAISFGCYSPFFQEFFWHSNFFR